MPDCFDIPLIGISGNCGYDGSSGLTLDQIGISLRKAANASDDDFTGKEFVEKIEASSINKVISDLKIELAKEFAFSPIYDVISQTWTGKKDICKTFALNTPIGLKIKNTCRDNFRSNRLDWIELYVDNAFTVEAIIQDGETQIPLVLEFSTGLNRINIDYTFQNSEGEFWIRLCNGAIAYENPGCCCDCETGLCGCNKCANVYSIEMVEGGEIECEEPSAEFLEANGFETAQDYWDSLGYQDSLSDGTMFFEPVCQAANFNLFGYQVSCLCSYDWLFCHFQREIAGPVLTQMGIQIFERSKFSNRFNEWVDAAKEQADYYIAKFLGKNNPLGENIPGEYPQQIKLVADMMKQYVRKSGTACLSCKQPLLIQTSIP